MCQFLLTNNWKFLCGSRCELELDMVEIQTKQTKIQNNSGGELSITCGSDIPVMYDILAAVEHLTGMA